MSYRPMMLTSWYYDLYMACDDLDHSLCEYLDIGCRSGDL